jgi:hypothetical protein
MYEIARLQGRIGVRSSLLAAIRAQVRTVGIDP